MVFYNDFLFKLFFSAVFLLLCLEFFVLFPKIIKYDFLPIFQSFND